MLERPLSEYSTAQRSALIAEAYARKGADSLGHMLLATVRALPFVPGRQRLTDTYLDDPALRNTGH